VSRRPATNTAASVRRRLLNLSRATGRSFNEVVQHCAHHESKDAQRRAFVRRVGLQDAPESFPHVWESVMAFLRPVVDAAALGKPFPASCPPGGPWVSGA
jgi:hypothetical protein